MLRIFSFSSAVSYIPEKVVVRPGENVTVYCVFNDLGTNASMALWILNFNHQLPHSQTSLLNRRVNTVQYIQYSIEEEQSHE